MAEVIDSAIVDEVHRLTDWLPSLPDGLLASSRRHNSELMDVVFASCEDESERWVMLRLSQGYTIAELERATGGVITRRIMTRARDRVAETAQAKLAAIRQDEAETDTVLENALDTVLEDESAYIARITEFLLEP